MPHVLVAGRIHEAGLDLLGRTEGFTVEVVDEVSTESYAPRVGGADAVLIRTQPMPANVIAKAGRLKIVSRHGVGYDAVDVEALNRRGIPLAVVGDVNTRSVAEHTLTLMLALAKRTLAYDAAVRDGDWGFRNSLEAIELNGRTLLVIGFGRIGRAVGALATAFGMRVLAYDPLLSASAIEAAGAEAAKRLDDALGEADVVTIHMPGNGRTLLGAAELARLKPTALIINTARGGIVDEAALAAALAQGRLGGAALDVFASEPPAADQPLAKSARTVLTPHAAALTQEGAARMSFDAARNIIEFFAGRIDPKLVVNAEAIALATSVAASAG
jgi:D-3-phosphoglycerate dehydrogenase